MTTLYTPFPVEVPYRTGPTMKRLGQVPESGRLFVVDEAYEGYLEQKLNHLARYPKRCSGLSEGAHEGLEDALLHVFSLLADEQPDLVRLEAETIELKALGLRLRLGGKRWVIKTSSDADALAALGRRVKTHLEAQPDLIKLVHALALSVQEDVVIL